MANFKPLIDNIKAVIKQNGKQEITGQVMQNILAGIVNVIQTEFGLTISKSDADVRYALKEAIGSLDNLTTAQKDTIVHAINSLVAEIGDLSMIESVDKRSVVDAINAIVSKFGRDLGKTETELATLGAKVGEFGKKTENISTESVVAEEDAIVITTDAGVQVGKIDNNGADFKNLKSNGKEVLTEHQDISQLATKTEVNKKQDTLIAGKNITIGADGKTISAESSVDDLPIEKQTATTDEEEIIFENNRNEPVMKITEERVMVKDITDMEGNPIGGDIGGLPIQKIDTDEYDEFAEIKFGSRAVFRATEKGVEIDNLTDFDGNRYMATKQRLNILAVGNSFTYDGLMYLNNFIDGSGKTEGITIYTVSLGGSSLEFWANAVASGKAVKDCKNTSGTAPSVSKRYGSTFDISDNNSLAEIFAHQWDILVIQQVSADYVNYSTYKPHLDKFLSYFSMYCNNTACKRAWQIVWSRGADYTGADDMKLEAGWNNIISATRLFEADFGRVFDIIIPTGTAVQNARNTSVNPTRIKEGHTSGGDLTRDWHHLAYGYGVWLAGACWYESLIKPFNKRSISEFDTYITVPNSQKEQCWNDYGTVVDNVNAENILELKWSVLYALNNPYEVIK